MYLERMRQTLSRKLMYILCVRLLMVTEQDTLHDKMRYWYLLCIEISSGAIWKLAMTTEQPSWDGTFADTIESQSANPKYLM